MIQKRDQVIRSGRPALSSGGQARRECAAVWPRNMPISAAFSRSRALGRTQGKRDEETAGCGGDRRVAHFIESKRPGARRKRRVGCGVGSDRFGPGGRSSRRFHRVFGRPRDCAILGHRAVGAAIAGPASGPSRRRWSARACCRKSATNYQSSRKAGRQSRAAGVDNATREGCANHRQRKDRAAGSGIRLDVL
jgi:hypothetical protein